MLLSLKGLPRSLVTKAQQPTPEAIFVRGRSGMRQPLFDPKERPLHEQNRGWAYIASQRNATAIASLAIHVLTAERGPSTKALSRSLRNHLKLYKGHLPNFNEDTREVEDHPILSVLANPNPLLDQAGLLNLTVTYLQMRANAYWYVVQNQLGEPLQFWPLPAQFMRVVMGENVINRYELLYGGGQINFDPDEIIHFRLPGPTDTIRGFGPVDAVGEDIETDFRMSEYERALFENNGLPDYIITPGKSATGGVGASWGPGQDTALQETMNNRFGGWRKQGKGFIYKHPLEITILSQKNRDLQFTDGKRSNREKIAAGFGVPDALLSLDGATFTNMAKGMQLWGMFTVNPMSMHLMNRINQAVMHLYGTRRAGPTDPNPRPVFWLVQESAVREDEAEQSQMHATYVGIDVLSRNEVRSDLGREPHEDGRGDDPLPVNADFQIEEVTPPDRDGDVEPDQQTLTVSEEEEDAATVNELTLGIERLARVGDIDGVNLLRNQMAETLGASLTDLPADALDDVPAEGEEHGNGNTSHTEPSKPPAKQDGDDATGKSADSQREAGREDKAVPRVQEEDSRRPGGDGETVPIIGDEDDKKDDDTKGATGSGGGDVPVLDSEPEDEAAFTPRTALEEFAYALHPDVAIKLSQPRVEHGLENRAFIAAMRKVFVAWEKKALANVPDFSKSVACVDTKAKEDSALKKMLSKLAAERQVKEISTPFMVAAFEKGVDLGHKDLAKKLPDLSDEILFAPEAVLKRIDALTDTFASSVVETTGDQLAAILREGVEQGWTQQKMAKLVSETFADKKDHAAKRIVRTETSNVLNQGAADEWKAAGIKKHEWLAAPNPCQFCEKMNGRVRTIGKAFLRRGDAIIGTKGGRHVAKYKTVYAPSLHPNCVCTLVPVIE